LKFFSFDVLPARHKSAKVAPFKIFKGESMPSERARKRECFWSPEWDYYKPFALNFIKENKWRCDPVTDGWKDLQQDCWIVFDRVRRAYPRVVEPQHFMSLFKTALRNEFATKARNRQPKIEAEYHPPADASTFYLERIGEVGNAGYAKVLTQQMPEEMRLVMHLAVNPKEIHHRETLTRGTPLARQNLNGKISRHLRRLGVNLVDPLGDLKRHLSS